MEIYISDEFDYAGSASLNMRTMDHLMSRTILSLLGFFVKSKPSKWVQMYS